MNKEIISHSLYVGWFLEYDKKVLTVKVLHTNEQLFECTGDEVSNAGRHKASRLLIETDPQIF